MSSDSSRRYFTAGRKGSSKNGAAAFQTKVRGSHQPDQTRIKYLEKKLVGRDEVLAELMAEHISLKEAVGEL
jgi:hypothetical protein